MDILKTDIINRDIYDLLKRLNAYSPSTYQHSLRVSALCYNFGRRIGLGNEELEKLKIGGLLHDIGKLKIDDAILHKPSKLTPEEYSKVKKHSVYGYDAGIDDNDILNMVLFHHERVDGLGYPNGMDRYSIPKLTLILTICDCYDAMDSKRIYKECNDFKYIKKELVDNSGKQFDTNYANLFLSYMDEIMLKEKVKK